MRGGRVLRPALASLAVLAALGAAPRPAVAAEDCAGLLRRFDAALRSGAYPAVRAAAQPVLDGGCPLQRRLDIGTLLAEAALATARAEAMPPAEEVAFLQRERREGASGWRLLARVAELAGRGSPSRSAGASPADALVFSIEAALAASDPARTRLAPAGEGDLARLRRGAQRAYHVGRMTGQPVPCPEAAPDCDLDQALSRAGLRFQVAPRLLPIRFETDRHAIPEDQRGEILRLRRLMRLGAEDGAGGFPPVCVVGHTDERGGREHNQALSERRARAVRDALLDAGVPAAAIVRTFGRGEDQPLRLEDASAWTPEDVWALNRRVEILTFDAAAGRCVPHEF